MKNNTPYTKNIIPYTEDNVVDFWEAVSPSYPKPYDPELCLGMKQIFDRYSKEAGRKFIRIADCGCGTGNPAIGLKKIHGYDVFCTDISVNMIERLRENLEREKCDIKFKPCEWRDLRKFSKSSDEKFDVVICRGNSLIYVTSWDRNSVDPEVSDEGIKEALRNFYEILRPGGILYVDITNKKEYNSDHYIEYIGNRHTLNNDQEFIIFWKPEHNIEKKIRNVNAFRLYLSKNSSEPEIIKKYKFCSYLLKHEELIGYMREAGFRVTKKDKYVNVPGEFLYDVFIGRKI